MDQKNQKNNKEDRLVCVVCGRQIPDKVAHSSRNPVKSTGHSFSIWPWYHSFKAVTLISYEICTLAYLNTIRSVRYEAITSLALWEALTTSKSQLLTVKIGSASKICDILYSSTRVREHHLVWTYNVAAE